jgi:RsiW-degrading membrane proteinase PrsW (M82 family)
VTTAVPTVECKRCEVDVPAGNFCGLCGCKPEDEPSSGSLWLRPKTFGAAPGQSVLAPRLASSLFPHLPTRSRKPFVVVFGLMSAGLAVAAISRLSAVGIAVSMLGLPLMFALYVRAARVDRDIPRLSLVLPVVLGFLLGAGWVLAAGHFISRTYGVPMAVGLGLRHLLKEGFIIPMVGMMLMMLPVVLVRLIRPGSRESLDGFVIGALGSLAFTVTATLTRLFPQFATGLIAHVRPVRSLVVQVVLCGLTVPITAAAAGGMLGIALWFREGGQPSGHHGRVRPALFLLAAAALLLHAGVAIVDIIGYPQMVMLVAHITMTVIVVIALRTSLQLALLHETHDPIAEDQPLLCPYCDMVVPDMAFCPACGAATRASSQESRRERRGLFRPRVDPAGAPVVPDGSEAVYPGYAMPEQSYIATPPPQPRFAWLLSRWGIVIVSAAVLFGGAALVLTPKIAHFMCPPDCGKPPTGTPVKALPHFEAPDGSFSVAYPSPGSAYTVKTTAAGVTATYTGGDGGVLQLFSEPAKGRSAKDVVQALVKRSYPDAKVAYEIPNAMVGYQPGYGELVDDWPQGAATSFTRTRVLVMAAVKNDLALVAFATGPYHAFGPEFGPGLPSGANLEIAGDMGKYVNSFRWKGDTAR